NLHIYTSHSLDRFTHQVSRDGRSLSSRARVAVSLTGASRHSSLPLLTALSQSKTTPPVPQETPTRSLACRAPVSPWGSRRSDWSRARAYMPRLADTALYGRRPLMNEGRSETSTATTAPVAHLS